MLAFLATLALLGAASAQNSTASTVDIEAIEAHFTQAQLVPELISAFNPEGTLSVAFGGSEITPGQQLDQTAVASYPTLTVTPASTGNATADSRYTVVMVDADVVGTDESTTPQTRHWLVNGASISTASGAPYAISYDGSTSVTDYAGPGPAAGSGSHRYVILVYLQPDSFSPPANLSAAGTPLGTMFLSSYVGESGLEGPVAANYFQVENGDATATVAATTAVETSTLSGAGSSTAASGTSAASGTTTGSAAGSGTTTSASKTGATSAAATTATGGAAGRASLGKGAIIGAVGVVGTLLGAAMGL